MNRYLLFGMAHRVSLGVATLLLSLVTALAQQPTSLKGQVVNEEGKAMPFVSVAMLRSDSTLVGGTTTDREGAFDLQPTDEVKLLSFSFVGYERLFVEIERLSSPIRMRPSSQELSAVEVRGKRPQLKLVGGELSLNVQGTTLVHQPDVFGVLAQLPGMMREGQEGVRLISGGQLLVYLDGREVHNMSELTKLDVSQIKSVKLNTMPGARYRSHVQAVLRIQTNRRDLSGLSLLGRLSARQASYHDLTGLFNLGYGTTKASYTASASYGNKRHYKEQGITMLFDRSQGEALESSLKELMTRQYLQLGTSADFTPNERLQLGAKVDLDLERIGGNVDDHSIASFGGSISDRIHSHSDPRNKSAELRLNSYLSYQASQRLSFYVSGDLVRKGDDREQSTLVRSLMHHTETPIHIDTDVKSLLYQLKPIATYNLSAQEQIEAGVELQSIHTASVQRHLGALRSDYVNREHLISPFVNYSRGLGQSWRMQVGLRYELSDTEITDALLTEHNVRRSYRQLFAQASLSGQMGKVMHALALKGYVRRPALSQLSNNTFYSSPYLEQRGNPLLRPEHRYNLSYNLHFGSWYFSLGYSYIQDQIDNLIYPKSDQRSGYILMPHNYKHGHELQLVGNYSKQWSWYTLKATIVGVYAPVDGKQEGLNITLRPMAMLRLGQTFDLPWGLKLNLDYSLRSRMNYSIFEVGALHALEASLTKSFLKDRLRLTLWGQDILRSYRETAATHISGLRMNQWQYTDSQSCTLTLTYRLNKERSYRGRKEATSAIDRL